MSTTAGVFARNHVPYLNRASAQPGRRAIFRSQIRWSGARDLLKRYDSVYVYLCPIPGNGMVEFAGRLVDVELDPSEASMAALMGRTGARNVAPGETLWDGACKTLYVVEIERLDKPFPMTELKKLSDGTPISADYGYSYCLVRERGL